MAKVSGLTEKQEAFAQSFFETGNAAEAYRRSYDVSENTKDHWLYVEASQLLDHPEVTLRVQDLRERAARMSVTTVFSAAEEYEEARQLALSEGAAAAAVSATTGKVKLFGLEAPKSSRHELVGKDGEPLTEPQSLMDQARAVAFLLASAGNEMEPD